MRYRLIPFFTVFLLVGCAGTQQASVAPVVNPVVVAESAPALSAEAVAAPSVVVADAAMPPRPLPSQLQLPLLDPLQCMVAWTKNVHGALMPQAQAGQIHAAAR